ncbi:hypothetical protein [Sphingomonas sp.]|uniref:hypothetical protein n=1 Tax=Sphingomonas sp. TaxID=28214 RepID=UPI00183CC33B|nr:hypothetical protein [Sphingomonas sp.]MBA3510455.1 hypothetical protein [Sphingomonas sp.]
MLTITDGGSLTRALNLPIDLRLKRLLIERRDQLGGEIAGHARFVLFGARDRPCWLEEALGFSIFQNAGDGTWYGDPDYSPGFDTLEDHGFCYELTFEFTADFTHVILIERVPGVHRDVLEFCAKYARQDA